MTTRTLDTKPLIVRHPKLVSALLVGVAVPTLLGANYVLAGFVVPGDPMATASNILESQTLYRLAAVAVLLVLTASVFVSLQFYWMLRPVGRNLAALMVALYLVGVCVALANEVYRFAIPLLLSQSALASSQGQLEALVSVTTGLHATGGLIAGLFWGLWLVPYGYLIYKSGFFPRFIGILLIIECVAFLVQSLGGLLVPASAAQLAALPAVTTWAELLVPVWLLLKGRAVEPWWEQRVSDSSWWPTPAPAKFQGIWAVLEKQLRPVPRRVGDMSHRIEQG